MLGCRDRKSPIWIANDLFGYRDSEFPLCLVAGITSTLFGYPILYLDSSALFGSRNSKLKKKKKKKKGQKALPREFDPKL